MNNLVQFLKVLSDKNRIRIVKLLEQRKMCVCELAYVLDVTQPAVSRHLKRMKAVGLVEDERDGFWTNYYLTKNSEQTKKIISCLKQWLDGDRQLLDDLKKLETADRTKMCR